MKKDPNRYKKLNGGRSVEGVSRINQENAIPTADRAIHEFTRRLGMKSCHTRLLGSTGKKASGETSGDIDIAISSKPFAENFYITDRGAMLDMIGVIADALGHKFNVTASLGLVSIAYPIVNADRKQRNQNVQLDFMISDNLEFSEWAYYSPAQNVSPYKGVYRNLLNCAVAKYADFKVLVVNEYAEPIEWSRYYMSLSHGLFRGTQTLISEKTGNQVKTPRYIDKQLVTDDPTEIVRLLYGPKYRSENLLTFEQTFNAVESSNFPRPEKRQAIYDMVRQDLEKRGFPLPRELEIVSANH